MVGILFGVFNMEVEVEHRMAIAALPESSSCYAFSPVHGKLVQLTEDILLMAFVI